MLLVHSTSAPFQQDPSCLGGISRVILVPRFALNDKISDSVRGQKTIEIITANTDNRVTLFPHVIVLIPNIPMFAAFPWMQQKSITNTCDVEYALNWEYLMSEKLF